MTYTYDPAQINANGRDQMRFELGDTEINGGGTTCFFCDEELDTLLPNPLTGAAWLGVKLHLVRAALAICRREVDTREDLLDYKLSQRAKAFAQMEAETVALLTAYAGPPVLHLPNPPYFYPGMLENRCTPMVGW